MKNVCRSCCNCFKSFCSFYITFLKYSSLSLCCCLFGMVLMGVVLLVYYGLFISFTPFVATEQRAVKPGQANSFEEFHPEINLEDEPLEEYLSEDEPHARNRQRRTASSEIQQSSTPTFNSEPTSSSSRAPSTTAGNKPSKTKEKELTTNSSVTDRFKFTKARFLLGSTTELPDTVPDFQLSNHLLDSVFSTAEAAGMKEPLGLCRKNADVRVPEVKATLFPAEEAGDILNCINDLLRNQTKKQICLHLDPEMNAYLRWLLMTGESRERHKPAKMSSKEDFLFPSTCVSTEDSGKATTAQCFAEPQDQADFDHR